MRRLHPVVIALALCAIIFPYIPLISVAVFSVNDTRYGLIWRGFTLKWYRLLIHDQAILHYTWNTMVLAVVSTLVATVLGTLLAVGMDRFPWTRKINTFLDVTLYIPVVIPDIIMAAALVVAYSLLRAVSDLFRPGLLDMILSHITFELAFVALVVRGRLVSLGKDVEEAGRDLFGSSFYLFRRVTLPLLTPAIIAGAMLAFTLSLDDFIISFFTAGPASTTLPLYIYGAVRRGVTPEIHALSTLMMLTTIVLVIGSERLTRRKAGL
ncbi:MAG: ABC transporter permease [Syntrophobacteraceae bacterium]